MANSTGADFLAGVIEGFYGPPWTPGERTELFGQMAEWGLNTYLYAPKDDLKHRTLWRETYSEEEAKVLSELVANCQQHRLRFLYALSPGLDIRYSDGSDLERIKERFEQMLALGCNDFALLFDDIPDRMDSQSTRRWDSLASAQAYVTNTIFQWTRERRPQGRFLFCPTAYCGRMAQMKLGGENYLSLVGRELLPEIDVFWTGPEIISREIDVAHIREIRALLRRKPLIWDNLHANDYDGRRFYCGPYSGRPPKLKPEVSGLLSNPNNEFPLNYVPLRTLAEFLRCSSPWDERQAYLAGIAEWLSRFTAVAGEPISFEDLVLFGDCFYLPYEEGQEAERLYHRLKALLSESPERSHQEALELGAQMTRLRDTCAKISQLKHRPLFYALYRRTWELREELDLLARYLEHQTASNHPSTHCSSDFHLPGTYRGGLIARLQRLLTQQPDGSLVVHKSQTASTT